VPDRLQYPYTHAPYTITPYIICATTAYAMLHMPARICQAACMHACKYASNQPLYLLVQAGGLQGAGGEAARRCCARVYDEMCDARVTRPGRGVQRCAAPVESISSPISCCAMAGPALTLPLPLGLSLMCPALLATFSPPYLLLLASSPPASRLLTSRCSPPLSLTASLPTPAMFCFTETRQHCKSYILHKCGHGDGVSAADCLASQVGELGLLIDMRGRGLQRIKAHAPPHFSRRLHVCMLSRIFASYPPCRRGQRRALLRRHTGPCAAAAPHGCAWGSGHILQRQWLAPGDAVADAEEASQAGMFAGGAGCLI
jgi:hypothetical protein